MKAYFFLLFLLVPTFAFAETVLTPFPKDSGKYLVIGYSGNYPIADSAKEFGPSQYHPTLGLRHISEDWVLGISVYFKFLRDKDQNSNVAIWTLHEEFYYRVRVYHPLYLLSGAKTLYLYPVQRGTYPFHRRDDLAQEIGIAASMGLLYFFPKEIALGAYVDLWRGTGSRNFEGLEFSMNLSIPLAF